MGRELMPAAFIGHGSPLNTLERNRYTCAWRVLGEAVPRPRAVLVISAHWYINATAGRAGRRGREAAVGGPGLRRMGTWSVAHMFPAADVPVVQLSINATKPWDYQLDHRLNRPWMAAFPCSRAKPRRYPDVE